MIQVPIDSVLGEGLLPGPQTATSSLYLHMMVERDRALVSSSSYKGTNPIMEAPPSSKLHDLPQRLTS